ncbi:MAG: hypothetical protein ABS35_26450 [Kaistia sp. SCN 65-12]|nr:MAG: hypothetical protein ABS35_26450 [Kaistia sp. SCN 65-12]
MHRSQAERIAVIAFIAIFAAVALFPIVWMLAASFKTDKELLDGGLFELGSAGIGNYVRAFNERPFLRYLLNSLFAAAVSVIITLLLGVLAAYGFAKLRNRYTEMIWIAVLASIMIPIEAIVIPLFLQVHAFGWHDSYAGIVLPTALNAAGIFILRQAIQGIPNELLEAGRIDGASEFTILRLIVVPLLAPSIVVVAVLTFSLSWNSYLWPLIITSADTLRTLPLGMAAFQMTLNTKYSEIMAVSTFGTIPMALLFVFLQRYFIDSAIGSGIK